MSKEKKENIDVKEIAINLRDMPVNIVDIVTKYIDSCISNINGSDLLKTIKSTKLLQENVQMLKEASMKIQTEYLPKDENGEIIVDENGMSYLDVEGSRKFAKKIKELKDGLKDLTITLPVVKSDMLNTLELETKELILLDGFGLIED